MQKPSYIHILLVFSFSIIAGAILWYVHNNRGDKELGTWFLNISLVSLVPTAVIYGIVFLIIGLSYFL